MAASDMWNGAGFPSAWAENKWEATNRIPRMTQEWLLKVAAATHI